MQAVINCKRLKRTKEDLLISNCEKKRTTEEEKAKKGSMEAEGDRCCGVAIHNVGSRGCMQ